MVTGKELAGFLLSENRYKDPPQGFGELVFKVVFGIDGDVVFEHV